MLRTPFDLGELASPGGAVPDLEVVVDAGDDDVAAELRVPEQRRRDAHPPLAVRDCLGRAGEEVTVEAATLPAEYVQRGEPRVDQLFPRRLRPRMQAPVESARDDATVLERPPELGRERQSVLIVDCVLVLAEKHGAGLL